MKEKEIQLLAKGLEQQNASHLRMDRSKLAHNHPGNDQSGGAVDRLLKQGPDTTTDRSGLTTTTMTTSAMETTADMDTPRVSGKATIVFVSN